MNDSVVITGIGLVMPTGETVDEHWDSLINCRSAIKEIVGLPLERLAITIGGQVRQKLEVAIPRNAGINSIDRASQLALTAAREALADSGLNLANYDPYRRAVIGGVSVLGRETTNTLFDDVLVKKKPRLHPLLLPNSVASMSSSLIATDIEARGPLLSLDTACTTATNSIIEGVRHLHAQEADFVVAGACESAFTLATMKVWEAMRVQAPDTCRAFSAERKGMVVGEGAAFVILEREQDALNRGANIYARIRGWGVTSDGGNVLGQDKEAILRAMQKAARPLQEKGELIDYVAAHGTGTIQNDLVESQAVEELLGVDAAHVSISSSKSMHGHPFAPAGAVNVINVIKAMQDSIVPPTANFIRPGDGCNLDYVPNEAKKKTVNHAMVNSFGFGGLNSVLTLSKV